MNLLTAENIVKRYASHTALNDVSINVPEQSVYGLLGPNGAGKTSLIRIINQITAPDTGRLFFNGEQLQPQHIQQIGYLPEERGLYKKMKVGEQAIYLAQLKGMKKSEAKVALEEWFEKFEITDWWNRKVEELSKGMAQKVQFITTVLHRPKLLILDEPFSGFDPINTNLIRQELLKMREEGTTIILSTHNMNSVEEICDHIALINRSEKIVEGPTQQVREEYASSTFEIEFKGHMMGFVHHLWIGYELVEQEELQKGHYLVQVKPLRGNKINNLLEAVMPVCEIIKVEKVVPSMNDVFIKLVEAEVETPENTEPSNEEEGENE